MSSVQSCALVVVMCRCGHRCTGGLGTCGHCSMVALNECRHRRTGVLSLRGHHMGDLCVCGYCRAQTRGPCLHTEALGLRQARVNCNAVPTHELRACVTHVS